MAMFQELRNMYGQADCCALGSAQLKQLRDGLKSVRSDEIKSAVDGKEFIELLKNFRVAVAKNDELHGDNYPQLLKSLFSVGEDGLYSNNLRFIFELIQNVDDCDYHNTDDCKLDIKFDFNESTISLYYNEVGFTPFNVFAITGIAEAAKNSTASENKIGEKGIGFKSVFGVASKVRIHSGWFSFELQKDNFTIPVASYSDDSYCNGTRMTLYVSGNVRDIYNSIKNQYCRKDAIFSRNPILFLNKLTSLKMYFDAWRSMEFKVSRIKPQNSTTIQSEKDISISVSLHDYENGSEIHVDESVVCTRFIYPVSYTREAYHSRYGAQYEEEKNDNKKMFLQVIVPHAEHVADVGKGSLYSFLPTQIKMTVPIVCHVPFKLSGSREYVDPQGENTWFQ